MQVRATSATPAHGPVFGNAKRALVGLLRVRSGVCPHETLSCSKSFLKPVKPLGPHAHCRCSIDSRIFRVTGFGAQRIRNK